MPAYDGHDGVLAQAEVAGDQAVAEPLLHQRHDPCGMAVGLGALTWLAPQHLPARLRSGKP